MGWDGMGWDGRGWEGMGGGKTWLVDLQRNQDVKKNGVADRGLAAVCWVDLEKCSDDEMFSIHSLAFMTRHEAARRASVSHLLWLKDRASKMCSSALVRTSVNQETECVYIMWLIFNVCRIWEKKSSLILAWVRINILCGWQVFVFIYPYMCIHVLGGVHMCARIHTYTHMHTHTHTYTPAWGPPSVAVMWAAV